jgi:hypothetical protein
VTRVTERKLQPFFARGQRLGGGVTLGRTFASQLHETHADARQDRKRASECQRGREHQRTGLARVCRHQRRTQEHRRRIDPGGRCVWQPARQAATSIAVAPAEQQEAGGADQRTHRTERGHAADDLGCGAVMGSEQSFDDHERCERRQRESGHAADRRAEARQGSGKETQTDDQECGGASRRDAQRPGAPRCRGGDPQSADARK